MIDPKEAYYEIMNIVAGYDNVEEKELDEASGRILAKEVVAGENIPPFARSPYDGFAFRAAETKGANENFPAVFEIAGTLRAGGDLNKLKEGKKAIKIMTGAPLPENFDCIVPKENVKVSGDKAYLYRALSPGENVVPEGEDIKKGDFIFSSGKYLTSTDIGVLASLGYNKIKTIKPPRVGLIITGDELVELGETPGEGEIRNSNRYILTAMLDELNIEGIYYGIVKDSKKELKDKIVKAKNEVDVLITTGGVSVGDFDLMPEVLEELRARRVFWRINGRPGTPLHVAVFEDMPVFSLSGNPAALFASYKIFVEKALLKMQNYIEGRDIYEKSIKGYLGKDIEKRSINQWRFLRAKGYFENGMLWCNETKKEKPGIISSLAESNGFIILPPGEKGLKKGDKIDFMPFNITNIFS